MSEQKLIPVIKDGMAQPVFPFTDGKTGDAYDAKTSDIVRYCVYVETDFDSDSDGKRDLVKVFVQVPRSAVEGNYKAASVFEARPYCAGTNADGYDHMKEVDQDVHEEYSYVKAYDAPARKPEGEMTTLEAAEQADPSSWYFYDKASDSYCYEDMELYNYYLVRGFAVIESAGIGANGSEGFNCVGQNFERDGFKAVVEWLHGDRVAYTDRTSNIEIKADWSNGNVAMTGRSYAGTMPFAVATTGVAGLKTIVPVAGIADWYSQQNQQGSQRYWPKEMLNSFLSYYCASRFSDPELTEEEREKYLAQEYQMARDQIACGFDYDEDFWGAGNYTLNADKIDCSALIVHGLNDENVATKQFEMMYKSFEKAGKNVKLILHQGPHMTPTMYLKGYGINVGGEAYDDVLNRWLCHYLLDVKNGAEDRPALLVQSNIDQSWGTEVSWNVEHTAVLTSEESGETVINTDWEASSVNAENFDERMSLYDSPMNQRFKTDELSEKMVIQGTPVIRFRAALKDGNPENAFGGENVNDVDRLSFALGTDSGKMDDVKMTVLLCDLSDEEFDSVQTHDPERNVIPVEVVREGAWVNGGDLPNCDEVRFETVNKKYKVISRAYIDLCNPESGYEPQTAAASIELKPGEFHDYAAYLNTQRYTVAAGHRLAVVLDTEDPVNCMIHKHYTVAIDSASVKAELPVTGAATEMTLRK